jgi:hypothetical protein
MKKNELIYLASPYSNGDRQKNFEIITEISADLISLGYSPISPITYGHTLLQFKDLKNDWEFWEEFCKVLLRKCDLLLVCMMDGWEDSLGVQEEIKFARELGIPIEYYNISPTSLERDRWFEMGYHDQCEEYPLLDQVWGQDGYPIEFRVDYRRGQRSAYGDGLANKPDFLTEE